MLRLFLILILSSSGFCELYSTKQCECEQLYEKNDCVLNQNSCLWLEEYNKCQQNQLQTNQVNGFCQSKQSKQQCLFNEENFKVCQWNGTYCSFFSGCQAFQHSTDQECQSISDTCITNGEYCIEKQKCSLYNLKKDCKKSMSGNYCYWNEALNTCQDVGKCEELPFDLKTDQECRQYLSYCTVNLQGGCLLSGENCSDQMSEQQCYYNGNKSQICFWDQNICKDKICSNASNLIVNEIQCQAFLQECTLKAPGGCRIKTSCEEAINQEACSTDINNQTCVWFNKKCYTKICKNAPLTFNSVKQCKDFSSDCTLKAGGGCKSFQYCKDLETEYACDFDFYGKRCVFDTVCRQEKCEEAPTYFNTQSQCSQYNQDCIVKSSGGCQQKKFCKDFISESTCSIDEFQNICYWTDWQECIDESSVKCNELLDSTSCSNQKLKQKQCIWKDKCFEKECVFAPKDYQTHDDCYNYDSRCTLSKDGGCQELPLTCGAHLSEESCQYRRRDIYRLVKCIWTSKQTCIDKNEAECEDLPFSFTTNNQCQEFSIYCVLNNPDVLNGKSFGCMTNKECIDKKVKDNCQTFNYITWEECYWNQTTKQCQEKTCTTTIFDQSFTSVTSDNCKSYLIVIDCIKNNDETGCMQFESCDQLSYSNCEDEYIYHYCFWDGIKCVDNTCSNLPFTTQQDCQKQNRSCVVNNEKSNCQEFAESCYDYELEENCLKDLDGAECYWNQIYQQCFNASCENAPNNSQYTTILSCEFYLHEAQSCMPKQRINERGCQQKKSSCDEYTQQSTCHQTLYNKYYYRDDCAWKEEKCVQLAEPYYINTFINDIFFYCKYQLFQEYSFKYGDIPQCQILQQWCSDYKSKDECTFSQEGPCYFDTTCQLASSETDCSYFSGNYFICQQLNQKCISDYVSTFKQCRNKECNDYSEDSFEKCQTHQDCTITINFDCAIRKQECTQYQNATECVQISSTQFCQWKANSCQMWDNQCETIHIDYRYKICSYYSKNCIYNPQINQCQTLQSLCSDYKKQEDCFQAQEGPCSWLNSLCNKLTSDQCSSRTGVSLDDDICKMYDEDCYVNQSGTACYFLKDDCSLYENLDECLIDSHHHPCGISQIAGKETCVKLDWFQDCKTIQYRQNTLYDDFCYHFFLCAKKDDNTCDDMTCQNAPQYYFDSCEDWSFDCINTISQTQCIDFQKKCEDYQILDHCTESDEGKCYFFQGKCVLQQCYQADPDIYNTHLSCNGFSEECTVADIGGCEDISPCETQYSVYNCLEHYRYDCYWKEENQQCVTRQCSGYQENYLFDSPIECAFVNCIIRKNGMGCESISQCQNYNQLQCSQYSWNIDYDDCAWNVNLDIPKCQIKSCSTASNQMQTHQQCNDYLFDCTVNAIFEQQSDMQVIIHKGCIPLSNCSSYISEEQCQINQDYQLCYWNGSNCDDISCLTAPAIDQYSNHEQCQLYLEGCTVNSNLLGCMSIPKTCEEMMIEQQCIQTDSGDDCLWLSTEAKCIKKTCEVASSNYYSNDLCNEFMPNCTQENQNMCYDVFCEEFKLTTEEDCKNAKSECTTDGYKYVKKHPLCEGALAQAGCTTNGNGQKCEWVTNYETPHCILRTCETAPSTLTTEKQCQDYDSPKCTTKYQGGCTLKQQCSNASVNEACTTNLEGKKCIWENSICRDIRCEDLNGKTDGDCKKQQKECTVGLNNKCAQVKQCEDTLIKDACILGLNGPCLWINDYVNLDKSKGACFQFNSCNSLKWTSDEMCKLISPYCTTDGQSCVSVTKCSSTNTSGGCVTGSDGDCIQITENEQKVCKLFNGCSEAKYFTHFECQQANKKCTAHSIDGCIELKDCGSYEQQSCYFNSSGQLIENGQILSTGKCIWSEENKKCRDQTCIDFKFTTHLDCFQQLKYCTTNGTNCIQQLNCDQYKEENSCQYGMDGICIWQNQLCSRMKSCAQVLKNEKNCKKVADRCYWESTSSSCLLHTCDTYFKTFGVCTKLFNINKSLQQFCSLNQLGQCVEIKPEKFSQTECLSISENSFRWYQSKCQVCQELKKIPDQVQLNVTFQNFINKITNSVVSFQLLLGLTIPFLIMN